MEYPVKIEGFEGHHLSVTSDEFISNPRLLIDGQPAPFGQKRGEYILTKDDGSKVVAQVTSAYFGFDPVPQLSLDGKKLRFMQPLELVEWVWSGIPLILFFLGGLLGTLFGILAFAFNVRVFRSHRTSRAKYLLAALISSASAGLTYGLPFILTPLINLIFHGS